jgi:hypothetical protein
LIERGFDRNDVDVRTTTEATTASRESTSWWEWLFGESEDRSYYSERVNRGLRSPLPILGADGPSLR